MRKACIAWLLAVLCLFGGCAPRQPARTESPLPPAPTDYRAEYVNNWGYRVLPLHMQKMYGALYNAVRTCHTDTWLTIRNTDGSEDRYLGLQVELPVAMKSADEAARLFTALTTDNPQFFFLSNTYSYEGYESDGVMQYNVFYLTLSMSADERTAMAAQMEQAAARLEEGCPEDADAYTRELFLHDALIAHTTYDTETAAQGGTAYGTAFTAYGALVEQKAVCEGYARAMQYLLHRAGIPCTLVSGTVNQNEPHMWNAVEIDGRGYHLDVTWDGAEGQISHTFFNVTTEQIEQSHRPDEDNVGVDTYTATAANYYQKEERFLDVYDRSLLAEAAAKQILSDADRVELQFSAKTFANAQLFFSNPQRVRQFAQPFLGERTVWDYRCVVNETYHTLTLYKVADTATANRAEMRHYAFGREIAAQ